MTVRKSLRFVSVLLVILLILCGIPSAALQALGDLMTSEPQTELGSPLPTDSTGEIREVTSLRQASVKQFRRSDGTYVLIDYGQSVHYLDDNNDWQEIDNTLTENSGGFVNAASDVSVKFGKKAKENNLLTLKGEDFTIKMGIVGANTDEKAIVENATGKINGFADLSHLDATITYPDVFRDTDLQYVVSGYHIKENIIVNAPQSSYSYTFVLNLKDLIAQQYGNSVLLQTESGEAVYEIPAPIMWDANGAVSDAVTLTLTPTGKSGEYQLTLTADAAWINADDRAFPVTVDPALNKAWDSNDVFAFTMENSPSGSSNGAPTWVLGGCTYSSSAGYKKYDLYWKNTAFLSNLPADAVVTNAQFSVHADGITMTNGHTLYFGAYQVLNDWTLDLVWNDVVSGTAGAKSTECLDYCAYASDGAIGNYNITKAVAAWQANPSSNYGIAFSALNSVNFWGRFSTLSQFLTIEYRDTKGLENHWSVASQSAGSAGTGSVKLNDGSLVFTHAIFSTTDAILPYTLTLTYLDDLTTATTTGKRWRLSCEESVTAVTISGSNYYRYTDSDGTDHYLKQDTSDTTKYLDEEGLQLTLTVSSSQAVLSDPVGNTKNFDGNGRLTKITDTKGNSRSFTYNSSGKPTAISLTTASGTTVQQLTLTYSSGLLSTVTLVQTGEKATFAYTSGNLTSITYTRSSTTTAKALFAYNTSGYLTTASDDIAKYRISYTRSGAQVTAATEQAYGTSTTTGQKVGFTYYGSTTKVRTSGSDDVYNNSDDLYQVYVFDTSGKTVSIYQTNLNGTVLYGAAGYEYADESTTTQNKVKTALTIGAAPTNLIRNGGFENGSISPWSAVGTGASSYASNSRSHTGTESWCLSTKTSAYLQQSVSLTAGTHTLSAQACLYYAGAVADVQRAQVYIGIYNSAGSLVGTASRALSAANAALDGVHFSQLSTTVNITSAGTYYVRLYLVNNSTANVSVSVYFDSIMLEKGVGVSNYNMVQNGDFNSLTDWTASNSSRTAIVTNASVIGDSVLRLQGAVGSQTRATQTVFALDPNGSTYYDYVMSAQYIPEDYVARPAQTFIVCGWAKADALPTNANRRFELQVTLHYVTPPATAEYIPVSSETISIPFAWDVDTWQFASAPVISDPRNGQVWKVELACVFDDQVNTAYFDRLSVIQDSDSVTNYTYDLNGNLETVTSSDGNGESYEYNEKSLVEKFTATDGQIYYFTYDSYGELTDVSVSGLAATDYTYNANGQITQTTITPTDGTNKTIVTSTQYSTNSATLGQTIKEIDALGNATTYTYSNVTAQLTSVLFPDGSGLSYTYDTQGRVTRITPTATVAPQNFVGYAYNTKGQMSTLTTGSTTYSFAYDVFGNSTQISIGSRTLASYTYRSYNGKLSSMTYGNGCTVSYTYDELDRIKEVWYNSAKKYTYTYNSEGNLWQMTDADNGTAYLYEYDAKGNLICATIVDGTNSANVKFRKEYSYDELNRIQDIVYSFPGATANSDWFQITYSPTYNTNGLLAKYEINHAMQAEFTYDNFGRLTQKRIGASALNTTTAFYMQEDYTYRSVGTNRTSNQIASLTQTYVQNENTFTTTYDYGYDAVGNITSQTITTITPYGYGIEEHYYAYDSLGQLVREDDSAANKTYVYTYDDAGNITSKQTYAFHYPSATPSNAQSTNTYTYGDSSWGDLLTSYNGNSLSYDSIGNLSYDGSTEYFYSWEKGRQLDNIVRYGGDLIAEYDYNADGVRIKKTVSGGAYRTYQLDGTKIISEYISSGNTHIVYLFDENGSAIGFQVTQEDSDGNFSTPVKYYFRKNMQGDIIAVYDSAGELQVSYKYDAWGNFTTTYASGYDSVVALQSLRYRGYYYDSETGWYYLNSRYYNPQWGRFVNGDGYVSTGQGLTGYNMLAYCLNNPVMYVDPNGEFGLLAIAFAVVIAAINEKSNSKTNASLENDPVTNTKGEFLDQDEAPANRYRYGLFPISHNGCEILSVHNARVLLGLDSTLSETTDRFTAVGAMIGFSGFFGSNPHRINRVLDAYGMGYTMVNPQSMTQPGSILFPIGIKSGILDYTPQHYTMTAQRILVTIVKATPFFPLN